MILDGIISTARQHFCDFGPSIPEAHMTLDNDSVLVYGPRFGLVDCGIQVIVPTFTALLSTPPYEISSDGTPFLGSCGTMKKRIDEKLFQDKTDYKAQLLDTYVR